MKRLAKELDIAKQIHFPGLLTKAEVKDTYLSSNIAIVASNSETFGQSIVEPYVIGRTVVSTPVGIAKEIIIDGVNGFIFTSQSELTKALIKIAENKQILIGIGETNFSNRDRFRWSKVTELYKSKLIK
jgi:glycosyltransferase involved in cell wall biosynthesis